MRKVTAAQQAEWTPENVASVGRSVAIVTGIGILLGIFAIAANLYYVAAIIGLSLIHISTENYQIARYSPKQG